MRHKVYGKHLGRTKNERTSLFKSVIGSLILHGSIKTSESKSKAIKGLVDKLINQAKGRDTKRLVTSFLTDSKVQEKLFKEVIPSLGQRNSGYISIIKLGPRMGDGARMVRMRLLTSEQRVVTSGRGGRPDRKTVLKGGGSPRSSKNKK